MSTLEAVGVRCQSERLLELEVGHDLAHLGLNALRVDGLSAHASESLATLLVLSALEEEARRLGLRRQVVRSARWTRGRESRETHDEEATNEEHGGEEDLQTDGDAPTGGRLDLLGSEVDELGDEDTDGDGELVERDDGSTDGRRSGLGLVHGNHHRDEADSPSGDDSADDETGYSLDTTAKRALTTSA
jgi:hypothetical protein